MKRFFNEFSGFLKQGNMIEIATGLLLATAFNNLVLSFSNAFILPIIDKLLAKTPETTSTVRIAGINFQYGEFLTSLISFIIVGFVLFMVAKGYNKLVANTKKKEQEDNLVIETELSLLKDIKEILEKDRP